MKYSYTDLTGVPHAEQWADKVSELQPEIEALGFVRIGYMETVRLPSTVRHVTEVYSSLDRRAFLEPEHMWEPRELVGRLNATAWTVFDDGFVVVTSLVSPYTLARRILNPWWLRTVRSLPGGLTYEFIEERSVDRLWAVHSARVDEHRVGTGHSVPPHDRVALLQVAQERACDLGVTFARTSSAIALIAVAGLLTLFGDHILPIIEVSWWRGPVAVVALMVAEPYVLSPGAALLCRILRWPRQVPLSELMRRSGLQGEFDAANPRMT